MREDSPSQAIHSQALEISQGWSIPGAPPSWQLTATMYSVLANDDDLLAIAAQIPADRLPALLFCAAACYLVPERASSELVKYFPVAGDAQPALDSGFGPAFRSFCLQHRSELLAVCHRLPPISMRIGIDIDPIDLADPDACLWARACIPSETTSLSRFDRAVELALRHGLSIRRGDAIELLPEILDLVPRDHLTVAVDTFTAVFFSDEQRARLREVLADRARTRDLAWISLDPLVPLGTAGRYSVQGLSVDEELILQYQRGCVFGLLGILWFRRGQQQGRVLARAHPSGTRVTWLDAETAVR